MSNFSLSLDCSAWPPPASRHLPLPDPIWRSPTPLGALNPSPCPSSAAAPPPFPRLCVASPPAYMQACCLAHAGLYQETCGWTVCATRAHDDAIRACLVGVDQFGQGNYSVREKGGVAPVRFRCVESGAGKHKVVWWVVMAAIMGLGVS